MTVDCPEWKLKATRLQETLVWPISQHAGTKEAAGQDLYFSDVQMTLAEAKRFPSLGVLRSKPRRTITSALGSCMSRKLCLCFLLSACMCHVHTCRHILHG